MTGGEKAVLQLLDITPVPHRIIAGLGLVGTLGRLAKLGWVVLEGDEYKLSETGRRIFEK